MTFMQGLTFDTVAVVLTIQTLLAWLGEHVTLGNIELTLGMVAVGAAIHHAHGLKKQTRQMDHLLERVWTQHCGEFPWHLDEIKDLIKNTTRYDSIDILADCADYGSFFAPELHTATFTVAPDAALTHYAQDVASVLVQAGLDVSGAAALDQLWRIARERNKREVVREVRTALRELDAACRPGWRDGAEAGGDPGLAPT